MSKQKFSKFHSDNFEIKDAPCFDEDQLNEWRQNRGTDWSKPTNNNSRNSCYEIEFVEFHNHSIVKRHSVSLSWEEMEISIILSEQPGIFFERMDGDWKILILIRTYVFFTLDSHLLGTFVQMIQIIDLILARVVHFVEKFEIVLKITPYALHRAQIQSDRSCEIVLYGSIANPFQTFPFFLPELKIVPSRFPICRKRHVDYALLICIHIIFTCNISCCRSYTASKNSLLKIGPNSRWPVVVSWYIYIYMTSDEIVWMTIQKRERERLPYRDPQIWYKLAQFCRKVGNENQSNFSRSLLCLWVLPKSL